MSFSIQVIEGLRSNYIICLGCIWKSTDAEGLSYLGRFLTLDFIGPSAVLGASQIRNSLLNL